MNLQPRLKDGRFISAACPECGYGTLRQEGRDWFCDGLADPEDDRKELEPCGRAVIDGELVTHNAAVQPDACRKAGISDGTAGCATRDA